MYCKYIGLMGHVFYIHVLFLNKIQTHKTHNDSFHNVITILTELNIFHTTNQISPSSILISPSHTKLNLPSSFLD
jgi:hypothetical protein